ALPQLSDSEITIRLMHLIASLRIAHTGIGWRTETAGFHYFPFRLRPMSDGWVVTATTKQYREALGARVMKIGSMTPELLEPKIADWISHENESWLHQQSPAYITTAELLGEFKLLETNGQVALTLLSSNRPLFTVNFAPGILP